MTLASPKVTELRYAVPQLAERALRRLGLRTRPIEFFRRLEQVRSRENYLAGEIAAYLAQLEGSTASRVLRAYAFAEELGREVLRKLCPELPPDGARALRLLSAAGVLLDQLLDESGPETGQLKTLYEWASEPGCSAARSEDGRPPELNGGWGVLATMLDELLSGCRKRAASPLVFDELVIELLALFDAEAASVDLRLEADPDEQVRRLIRQKSVGLCWAGFRAGAVGLALAPSEHDRCRSLCETMGEIMWIVDDLADVAEDFHAGVWNRTLWGLYDAVGKGPFRAAVLGEDLRRLLLDRPEIVTDQVQELAHRTALLETQASPEGAADIRRTLSFWITAWLEVYA